MADETPSVSSFEEVEPAVESDPATPEYVQDAVDALNDIFHAHQDVDAELDEIRSAKRLVVESAQAFDQHEWADDRHTLGGFQRVLNAETDRLVACHYSNATFEISAEALALAAYAEAVQEPDSPVEQLGGEWTRSCFDFIRGALHDLAAINSAGKTGVSV